MRLYCDQVKLWVHARELACQTVWMRDSISTAEVREDMHDHRSHVSVSIVMGGNWALARFDLGPDPRP